MTVDGNNQMLDAELSLLTPALGSCGVWFLCLVLVLVFEFGTAYTEQ